MLGSEAAANEATGGDTKTDGATPEGTAQDKGGAATGAAADGKAGTAPAAGVDGKAVDAGAEVEGEEAAGDGEASPLDDGGDDAADAAAAKTAGEGKDKADKKAATTAFAETRAKAIDRGMAKLEASLSKTLTAAELPKALAKEKAKLAGILARYGNTEDALLALAAKEELIRSGKHKQPLTEDATDEEKAADRKERGIPEKAEAYEIPQVPGHKWTEADNPNLGRLKEVGHKLDMTQAQLGGVAALYAQIRQDAALANEEARAAKDKDDNLARRDRRREAWGAEAKGAFTVMERALKDPEVFPDNLGVALGEARLPDGTRLVNHAGFEPFLYQLALGSYGESSMPSGDAAAALLSSREEEIAKVRDTDIQKYRTERNSSGQTMAEEMLDIQRKKSARGGKRSA